MVWDSHCRFSRARTSTHGIIAQRTCGSDRRVWAISANAERRTPSASLRSPGNSTKERQKNASFASDPYSAQRRCETISRKARGRGDTYALPGKTYEAYQWKRVFYYQHSSRLDAGMCWAVGTRMEGHVIKRLSIVSAHVAVSPQKRSKRQLM